MLGRRRSAPLFPTLAILGVFFASDAALGLTWRNLESQAQREAARVTEIIVATSVLCALVMAWSRDLLALLRGRLQPKIEGELYPRIALQLTCLTD